MPFPYDKYPWLNFQELNLAYFIKHFREIFQQWDQLYHDLLDWKDATDANLAEWKTAVEAGLTSWETGLTAALESWKLDTHDDISEWERDVIAALEQWKTVFLAEYDSLEARVEAIVSSTEDMVENLAFPFSTNANYSKNDYVIYNGVLYRFVNDHSAGAWNANDVTQVTATDDITDLEYNVQKLRDAIGYTQTELLDGYTNGYWNSETDTAVYTYIASNYCAWNPIAVTPGERYAINAFQGTSARQNTLLFVDADYHILERYGQRVNGYLHRDVVAPVGAVYALITTGSRSAENLAATSFTRYDLISIFEYLKNKNVAILGDSISTNGDLSASNPFGNVPEIVIGSEDVGISLSAYATYYDIGTVVGGHEIVAADVGTEITFTPAAEDVGKMVGKPLSYNPASTNVWWEDLMNVMNFNPIPVCWSGASVSSHEGDSATLKTSYAWHDAQIRKCGVRTPGTMTRTPPDLIIIYRGTNDFSHSPYAKLTPNYFASYNWQYPSTDVIQGGYGFKEALSLTIKKLRDAYPNSMIILSTLNIFKRVNYSHFPTNNGENSLPQYNAAIREVAEFFGCGLIQFDKDGITFENCYSGGYITDSATTPTHPNNKGQRVMANRAIIDLAQSYNKME